MKRLVLLIFFFFFLYPQKASASFSFSIANISDSTLYTGDQILEVGLNISDLPSGDSYFRVSLQKENGTYFGYVMDNNGSWSVIQTLGGDCTGYFKLNDSSITSAVIKYKVGDDIKDSGSYKLKAHRFTSTCKSNTEATNNSTFFIGLVFPTSTPTPTSLPSATPASSPTKTPTPYPSSTPTLTPKITSKAVKSASIVAKKDSTVSGENTFNIPSLSPTVKKQSLVAGESDSNKNRLTLIVILFSGAILFIIAAGILIKKYHREIIEWINS